MESIKAMPAKFPHSPSRLVPCATVLVAASSVNRGMLMNNKCPVTTWSVWQMLLVLSPVGCLTCPGWVTFVEGQTRHTKPPPARTLFCQ